MNKVAIKNSLHHEIKVDGVTVGWMRKHYPDGGNCGQWYAMLRDPRTGEVVKTANSPELRIASQWARQDLEQWTVEQVIDRYHPQPVAKPALPADESGPSLKYTLTLRDWSVGNEDGEPEHTTVATCDSKAHMLQAVQRVGDDAYKHYVTVWDYQWRADGDIVEQANAQEWLEAESMVLA